MQVPSGPSDHNPPDIGYLPGDPCRAWIDRKTPRMTDRIEGIDGASVNLSNGNSTTTAVGGSYRFDNFADAAGQYSFAKLRAGDTETPEPKGLHL